MRPQGRCGSMVLIAVFIYFLFSALGLGMIYISQVHLKLSEHKKNMTILAYSAENGVKLGFSRLAELVAAEAAPVVCTEDRYAALREGTQAGDIRLAEEALRTSFPFLQEETGGDQIWRCSSNVSPAKFSAHENFFLADFAAAITGEGELRNFRPKKKSSLDASLKILAGRIPLAYFPLLIARNLDPAGQQNFRDSRNIILLPLKMNAVIPGMNFTDEAIIPDDVDPLLKKALAVKIFSPEKLSRAELRAGLGLEMIDEPVPEGVYLIQNDMGLGGVYVQGDLDEMILALKDDFQIVSFRRGSSAWLLKFSPQQGKTYFSTPSDIQVFDRVPLGIIMVNGRILSLGGGIVNAEGRTELKKDEAVPCILQGVSLSIVSSDQVTISSHLIHQGVKWLDGIPYLRDSTSQLMIYANGRDFLDNTEKAGKIVIDPNAPKEINVQAALTAKNSVESEGSQKTLVLAGGLQAGNIVFHENTLKIMPDERLIENKILPQDSPATARPLILILSFRPLQWNES